MGLSGAYIPGTNFQLIRMLPICHSYIAPQQMKERGTPMQRNILPVAGGMYVVKSECVQINVNVYVWP